jgi:hypothetical protein
VQSSPIADTTKFSRRRKLKASHRPASKPKNPAVILVSCRPLHSGETSTQPVL